jgi:hypothetical protein
MAWKLHTSDDRMQRMVHGFEQHDSKKAACDRMRQIHIKVLYIAGPHGERIEAAAIVAWCEARSIGEDWKMKRPSLDPLDDGLPGG